MKSSSFNLWRSAPRSWPRSIVWILFVLALPMEIAQAQLLTAVGDSRCLWMLQPDPEEKTLTILQRQENDTPGMLRLVQTQRGRTTRASLAAAAGTLWIVYAPPAAGQAASQSLLVQAVRTVTDGTDQLQYEVEIQSPLPQGLVVRGLAANADGPWALVRVEQRDTLRFIDADQLDVPATQATAFPQTRPAATGGLFDSGTATAPAMQPRSRPVSPTLNVDRLLNLEHGRWVRFPLPEDWPVGTPAWVVMSSKTTATPLLVAIVQDANRVPRLRVYQFYAQQDKDGGGWKRWDGLENNPGVPEITNSTLAFTAVEGQLVLAQRAPGAAKLAMRLFILRSEGISNLGELQVDAAAASTWTVTCLDHTVALLAQGGKGEWLWSRMDLRGQVAAQPPILTVQTSDALVQYTDYMVWIGALVVAMTIMFAFWRRDPAANRLALPHSVTLAENHLRAVAGLIDLAPCIGLGLLIFQVDPRQVQEHWPGSSGSWIAMLPGATGIGLYILHCTLTEMFTGRTLGKMLIGLRVTDLAGRSPNVWQVLARNLLKVLDLVAPPLLILPLISPHRQRLGDLVARTVVVSDTPPTAERDDYEDDE